MFRHWIAPFSLLGFAAFILRPYIYDAHHLKSEVTGYDALVGADVSG